MRPHTFVALIMMLGTLLFGCGQPPQTTPAPTFAAETAAAEPFDHALFNEIVQAHVKNGFVDYAALKAQHATEQVHQRSIDRDGDDSGAVGRDLLAAL